MSQCNKKKEDEAKWRKRDRKKEIKKKKRQKGLRVWLAVRIPSRLNRQRRERWLDDIDHSGRLSGRRSEKEVRREETRREEQRREKIRGEQRREGTRGEKSRSKAKEWWRAVAEKERKKEKKGGKVRVAQSRR